VRYPGRDARENPLRPAVRDLAPPVFADGRLYVAPADYDHLLCLDPFTGRTLWDRDHLEPTHLLGVGQGKFIFTTLHGLRAVDAADGGDKGGWQLPDGGGERAPAGRGLLIGNKVLWPTANGVVVCNQADGALDYRPMLGMQVPSGNLVYANGCLAVADRTTLSVFVPDGLLLEERKDQTRQQPEDADAWLGRARAESDAGQFAHAQESLRKAREVGRSLPENPSYARLEQEAIDLSITRAYRAALAGDWAAADEAVKEAVAADQPARTRLESVIRAAEMWEEVRQPARAVAAWQMILTADELRGKAAFGLSRRQLTAGDYAAERIDRLKAKHGKEVYEAVERRFAQLRDDRRAEEMETLVASYPNADGVSAALGELARLHEKAGRPGAAAQAWRRLLARGDEQQTGPALIGLARAYEQEQCWEAAVSAWQRLARTAGDKVVSELDVKVAVAEYVARHLATLPPPPAADDLRLPLSRQWQIRLAADEHLLPSPDADADAPLLTGRPGLLTARAADTGKPRWFARLSFDPQWAARRLDTVVAAGAGGAACLRQDDGGIIWDFAVPTLFAGQPPAELGSFQLADGRFFFLAQGQWLFVLDAESGVVLWQRSAPGAGLDLPSPLGRFNPAFIARDTTVLIQPTLNRTLLLNAANGQTIQALTYPDGSWWPNALSREDFAFCLAPNGRTIIQIGGATGRTHWEHTLTDTTLTGEPARLIGRKDVLLALVPTSLGDRLERLEPGCGKPLWQRSPPLSGKSRPTGWVLDDTAAYYAQDGRLYARSLTDGKLLWARPLGGPDGPYEARRLRDFLLSHPASTGTTGFQFRFLWGSVQWEKAASRDDSWPLVCSDPKTGQVIQRINLSPPAPPVAVRVRCSTRFTLQPEMEVGPAASDARRPVVLVSARGVVAGVGDQLYGLKPAEK
jgi:outer membrane protein assembly factor BamB/tetratricopeptide (TPR) repeat protein